MGPSPSSPLYILVTQQRRRIRGVAGDTRTRQHVLRDASRERAAQRCCSASPRCRLAPASGIHGPNSAPQLCAWHLGCSAAATARRHAVPARGWAWDRCWYHLGPAGCPGGVCRRRAASARPARVTRSCRRDLRGKPSGPPCNGLQCDLVRLRPHLATSAVPRATALMCPCRSSARPRVLTVATCLCAGAGLFQGLHWALPVQPGQNHSAQPLQPSSQQGARSSRSALAAHAASPQARRA